MNSVVASKHNRSMSKEIVDDIARTVSEDIANFMIELRDELEKATPVDTTHGSINWLIRKRVSNIEYGERPVFPSPPDDRPYDQPTMTIQMQGVTTAVDYDIREGNGQLVVFNNADYLGWINGYSHPAQFTWEDRNGKERKPSRLVEYVGFIDNTIAKVEGKYGIS